MNMHESFNSFVMKPQLSFFLTVFSDNFFFEEQNKKTLLDYSCSKLVLKQKMENLDFH